MGKRKERSDPGWLIPPSAVRGKNDVELHELACLATLVRRGKARDRALSLLLKKAVEGDPDAVGMLYLIFVRDVRGDDYLRLLEHWRIVE